MLHDLLVTVLKRHPTPLLTGLEKYFAKWQDKIGEILTTTETAFDFTLLEEWNKYFNMELEGQKEESSTMTNVPGTDVHVPDDVAAATFAPSSDAQKPVHQATIHVTDEDNAILFLSVAINICFIWIISVLIYEYCCRPRWNATVVAKDKRNKEENVLLMEQEGWISYEEDPVPAVDGIPRTRSSPFKDDAAPAEPVTFQVPPVKKLPSARNSLRAAAALSERNTLKIV